MTDVTARQESKRGPSTAFARPHKPRENQLRARTPLRMTGEGNGAETAKEKDARWNARSTPGQARAANSGGKPPHST